MRPLLIGVAGGSGAGKTTVARQLNSSLRSYSVTVLEQDSYYLDRSHLTVEERESVNYDHPDAIETELLLAHLVDLARGRSVDVPVYDFNTHTRLSHRRRVTPGDVVIVEGTLLLCEHRLRETFHFTVFVDTDEDIRFIRRLRRDLRERGRTVDSVIDQYLETVKPMHHRFVESTKKHAHLLVAGDRDNRKTLETLVEEVRSALPRAGAPGETETASPAERFPESY